MSPRDWSFKTWLGAFFTALLACIGLYVLGTSAYTIEAGEIVVFQRPITGELSVETQPGSYWRLGSSAYRYRKQDHFDFKWVEGKVLVDAKTGDKTYVKAPDDQAFSIQFNDGGKAEIGGNIQWEMPTDREHIIQLHTLYGSQRAIDDQIIRNVVNRSIIYSGPHMSATESYAARRSELLTLIATQMAEGIYEVRTRDITAPDPITGERKTVKTVEIVRGRDGQPLIAEESTIKKFGIRMQPPTISTIVYEPKVEDQIQKQRDLTLQIQTAQAEAKQAEQQKLTAIANGGAAAAKAEADQNVIKAREVTKAEQEKAVAELNAQQKKNVAETQAQQTLDVAKLGAEEAEQYKRKQILEGEGDAEKKRLILAADGALELKSNTVVRINQVWADAYSRYGGDIVPKVQMNGRGGDGAQASNGFEQAMQMIAAKAASDMALDLSITHAQPTAVTRK